LLFPVNRKDNIIYKTLFQRIIGTPKNCTWCIRDGVNLKTGGNLSYYRHLFYNLPYIPDIVQSYRMDMEKNTSFKPHADWSDRHFMDFNASMIDRLTLYVFLAVLVISVSLNIRDFYLKRHKW